MKPVRILSFALLAGAGLCMGIFSLRPSAAQAQNERGRGWVEGVIVTDRGTPAWGTEFLGFSGTGARITIRPREGNGFVTESRGAVGGLYTFRDLSPGVYELTVDRTWGQLRSEAARYRPQHIFGLVVEADKRTILNITVHEGEALEEVGQPVVESQPAIILSRELARLQAQIDELKKR